MSVPDGQIAAIARRDQLAGATRNVRDFEGCGIEGIDPFEVAVRGALQRRSMAGICGPTTSRVISRSGGTSTR